MRVDKYLSAVGLVRRTQLKKNNVEIKINGKKVKPSKEVRVGDVISFTSPTLIFKIEVIDIPLSKAVPKMDRDKYYRVRDLKKKKREIESEFIKWLLRD